MRWVQERLLTFMITPVGKVVVVNVDLGKCCQSLGNLISLCVELRDGPANNES